MARPQEGVDIRNRDWSRKRTIINRKRIKRKKATKLIRVRRNNTR
jgi:hypothetical protein